ncbi:50S ribosomal protein L29 [Spiroplasma corruscae]|uniref:Large ribosomal subunit protein uL29 n=1 Tax=Spiroplasma corruscae TaxID=216934 RepID=A0A222ER73_9MOLU|nr:50S ribosomal protein L29 [Spiroplasma corruscae]ASP28704.1 50S ribosomal protein L29 [Spiroplasma corruscae]
MSKSTDFVMELRTKKVEDLIKLGEDRRAELFALKFQAAIGSLEQTHKIKALRKDIARIELLLVERRKSGEKVDQIVIKPDYTKAVENAEKAGKEVRKKQREMLEKLQQEQSGNENSNQVSEDAILAAMNAAVDDSESKPVTKKPAAKKETTVKAESKPVTKKPAAKKETTVKAESKPAAKKETTVKAENVEVALNKEAAKKTGKASAKTKTVEEEIELHQIDTSEAKGTGKGKAALKDVKTKSIKVGTVQAENVEGIDLKLSAKPKNAKTYTFGSNAQEAKKQIEEANKKLAAKKTVKTTADKPTTAKKTTSKKGEN